MVGSGLVIHGADLMTFPLRSRYTGMELRTDELRSMHAQATSIKLLAFCPASQFGVDQLSGYPDQGEGWGHGSARASGRSLSEVISTMSGSPGLYAGPGVELGVVPLAVSPLILDQNPIGLTSYDFLYSRGVAVCNTLYSSTGIGAAAIP